MQKGFIIAISGFSGAGKGTVVNALMERYPEKYALSVSVTTREPRLGEQEGIHYFFRSVSEFEAMLRENELVEHNCFLGNYYGTPKSFVDEKLESGLDVLLEIDVNGVMQVRDKYPDTVMIFVAPPSVKELIRRLEKRGSETEESIKKRLATARKEAEFIPYYEHLLVNDDLEETVTRLNDIVDIEHAKVIHQENFTEKLKKELEEELS